jgi:hypothetical protein
MDALQGPYVANFKNVEVKISDGSLIKGKANFGENYKRLSDLFQHTNDSFIQLFPKNSTKAPKKSISSIKIISSGPGPKIKGF